MKSTPLFGGAPLADWIRDGGKLQRRIIGHRAQLLWHAFWFERNWQAQLRQLDTLDLPNDPVFIR
jgi:hypothetical protein